MALHNDDRARILKALEMACDDVLLRAIEDHMGRVHAEQSLWEQVRGFVGNPHPRPTVPAAPAAAPVSAGADEPAPGDEDEDTDVEPPGEACTRIGADTKSSILAFCRKPKALEDIRKHIKKGEADTVRLLKLLWVRDDLRYDGESYVAVQ